MLNVEPFVQLCNRLSQDVGLYLSQVEFQFSFSSVKSFLLQSRLCTGSPLTPCYTAGNFNLSFFLLTPSFAAQLLCSTFLADADGHGRPLP